MNARRLSLALSFVLFSFALSAQYPSMGKSFEKNTYLIEMIQDLIGEKLLVQKIGIQYLQQLMAMFKEIKDEGIRCEQCDLVYAKLESIIDHEGSKKRKKTFDPKKGPKRLKRTDHERSNNNSSFFNNVFLYFFSSNENTSGEDEKEDHEKKFGDISSLDDLDLSNDLIQSCKCLGQMIIKGHGEHCGYYATHAANCFLSYVDRGIKAVVEAASNRKNLQELLKSWEGIWEDIVKEKNKEINSRRSKENQIDENVINNIHSGHIDGVLATLPKEIQKNIIILDSLTRVKTMVNNNRLTDKIVDSVEKAQKGIAQAILLNLGNDNGTRSATKSSVHWICLGLKLINKDMHVWVFDSMNPSGNTLPTLLSDRIDQIRTFYEHANVTELRNIVETQHKHESSKILKDILNPKTEDYFYYLRGFVLELLIAMGDKYVEVYQDKELLCKHGLVFKRRSSGKDGYVTKKLIEKLKTHVQEYECPEENIRVLENYLLDFQKEYFPCLKEHFHYLDVSLSLDNKKKWYNTTIARLKSNLE